MLGKLVLLPVLSALGCPWLMHAQAVPDSAAPATVTIRGDVPAPLTLTIDDLDKMPQETATLADKDGTKATYAGVPLREVMKRAGAPSGKQLRGKALASYLVAKGQDGYEIVFTLAELDAEYANESILLADKRDGKALAGSQGPLRIVCSNDKMGARSLRMLKTLELVNLEKQPPQ